MKKVWEKPKLVVLFRGKPEEAVLATCKYSGWSTGNPSTQVANCEKPGKCGGQCDVLVDT